MRRRKPEAHENHERWLVSYADFITLLFAFFVVMFANSNIDKAKARQISESVRQAMEEGRLPTVLAGFLGGTRQFRGEGNTSVRAPEGKERGGAADPSEGMMAELLPSLDVLSQQLKKEIETGQMKISMEARGLVITLRQAAFFPSGGDDIAPERLASLEKVADSIRSLPNQIRLEGHTDAIPIHNARFRSNWELSAARSIAMLELFATRCNIPRTRMAIAGYADTVPVEPNDTDEGRGHNRRVDIVVLNQTGIKTEPKPAPENVSAPAAHAAGSH
ncbi:MAG: flagellar motor protein MotB [Bryobacteraceae bacterium]|nr:flagellar motor protein MotB [Bryobacteraceae bacterium]